MEHQARDQGMDMILSIKLRQRNISPRPYHGKRITHNIQLIHLIFVSTGRRPAKSKIKNLAHVFFLVSDHHQPCKISPSKNSDFRVLKFVFRVHKNFRFITPATKVIAVHYQNMSRRLKFTITFPSTCTAPACNGIMIHQLVLSSPLANYAGWKQSKTYANVNKLMSLSETHT